MKRILIALCSIIFLLGGIIFLCTSINENDMALIVPAVLLLLGGFLIDYLLIKEIFIGNNEYIFDPSVLKITRKGKLIESIEKEKIKNVVVIRDMLTKKEEAVFLTCKKRRFYIPINSSNREMITAFIGERPYKFKENLFYYLISFFN